MPDYLVVPLFVAAFAAAITAATYLAHRLWPPEDRP